MVTETSNGIVIGIVKDLDDPINIGRVMVEYPHLDGQESNWCRLATPMAGKDRGLFMRPEKGDEVLVCFEHGRSNRPFIVGGVWSSDDKPPADDGKPVENNWRFLKSRSGHVILFDDTQGKEKINIASGDGKRRILIDVSNDLIEIVCSSGDISVKAGGKASIEAKEIELTASAGMKLKAGGKMEIKGATVDIN